jgi:hypothetical protein
MYNVKMVVSVIHKRELVNALTVGKANFASEVVNAWIIAMITVLEIVDELKMENPYAMSVPRIQPAETFPHRQGIHGKNSRTMLA